MARSWRAAPAWLRWAGGLGSCRFHIVTSSAVQAAVELCWLTCVASELNGEELTRSGGVAALGRLLQRCLAVLPRDAQPSAPAAGIATSCLRAFAGMAAFPNARAELAARRALSSLPCTVLQPLSADPAWVGCICQPAL